MVDNGVSVDAHTFAAASGDQVTEVVTGTAATLQVVRDGLIVEPPGVKFSVLGPFVSHNRLHSGENLDTHPAHSSDSFAFLFNISVRPAEHLNNSTLLTILISSILNNLRVLPQEIESLKRNFKFFVVLINGFDSKTEGSITERRVSIKSAAQGKTRITPVVLDINNGVVLAATSLNLGTLAIGSVDNIVIAHNATVTFVN